MADLTIERYHFPPYLGLLNPQERITCKGLDNI